MSKKTAGRKNTHNRPSAPDKVATEEKAVKRENTEFEDFCEVTPQEYYFDEKIMEKRVQTRTLWDWVAVVREKAEKSTETQLRKPVMSAEYNGWGALPMKYWRRPWKDLVSQCVREVLERPGFVEAQVAWVMDGTDRTVDEKTLTMIVFRAAGMEAVRGLKEVWQVRGTSEPDVVLDIENNRVKEAVVPEPEPAEVVEKAVEEVAVQKVGPGNYRAEEVEAAEVFNSYEEVEEGEEV
jgi:hypothetical protein